MFDLSKTDLRLLVVGGGGREHALCWKLAQSQHVSKIFCAPGNGGTAFTDKTENVPISVSQFEELAKFSTQQKIDLIVVGPDNPLAEGIVDHLSNQELRVFGPSKEEARIEWSKAYAKSFLARQQIPTPKYIVVKNLKEAKEALTLNAWPKVVKADGLAFGKGVYVLEDQDQVLDACKEMFEGGRFGEAGKVVLLEEKIIGEELSLLMLCDGKTILPLASSQDYKRRFDGNQGPNTGGMGAYSPVPLYERHKGKIEQIIIEPLKMALKTGTLKFKGLLYAGIIIARHDSTEIPMVLEFNARFGDPETQTILPRLRSDLLPALWACTESELADVSLEWKTESSCCVVAVSKDYPDKSANGDLIAFSFDANGKSTLSADCVFFHSGTKYESNQLKTAGGRIISVTGLGATLLQAREKAYAELEKIQFANMDYRSDIAALSKIQAPDAKEYDKVCP